MQSIYKSEAGKRAVLDTYEGILKIWPVPSRQYTVRTAYGDTFVIESGNSEDPPLLLLHGSLSNSFTWFADAVKLSESHHVFAVDIIGEAGFSAENRPTYRSGAYQKWLSEVIQKLGVKTCSIAGLSLGGWLALRYATVFPEKVDNLVLLCPGGLAREKRSFIWKAMFLKVFGKSGSNRIFQGVMGSDMAQSNAMSQAIAYAMLIGKHEKPRMEKLTIFTQDELSRLTMPILVLFGDNDIMLRAGKSIERISRSAPNVQSEILPNTGHGIVGQAGRILAFLNK